MGTPYANLKDSIAATRPDFEKYFAEFLKSKTYQSLPEDFNGMGKYPDRQLSECHEVGNDRYGFTYCGTPYAAIEDMARWAQNSIDGEPDEELVTGDGRHRWHLLIDGTFTTGSHEFSLELLLAEFCYDRKYDAGEFRFDALRDEKLLVRLEVGRPQFRQYLDAFVATKRYSKLPEEFQATGEKPFYGFIYGGPGSLLVIEDMRTWADWDQRRHKSMDRFYLLLVDKQYSNVNETSRLESWLAAFAYDQGIEVEGFEVTDTTHEEIELRPY